MFQQYTGDGVSIFSAIVAVLIGFVAALGYIDFRKVKEDEKRVDKS